MIRTNLKKKKTPQLLLMFCIKKMRKYILPKFQNMTQILKNIILTIQYGEGCHYLGVKSISIIARNNFKT